MTPKEFLEQALKNVNNGRPIGHGLLYGDEPSEAVCLHHIDFTRLGDSYSLAPKTHIVNGFEVPVPETEPLVEDSTYYFAPNHFSKEGYTEELWIGAVADYLALKNKQVFSTKEAAQANQKAQAFINPNL